MSASTSTSASASLSGVTWVNLQDPGASTHPRGKADVRDAAVKRIVSGLQGELRVDDPKHPYTRSTAPPPQVYYYAGTETDTGDLYASTHGLFDACHHAWAQHASLVLSPDDIWLAIQGIFAEYMSKNAEALRSAFVAHDGQKDLCVSMDDSPTDWPLFVERVVKQVTAHSKVDMSATFVPAFTSSTPLDVTMKHVAVMNHMKAYFSYSFMLCCGVRRVGLRGEIKDWELLRTYIQGLRAFAIPAGDSTKDAYFLDESRTYTSWLDDLTTIADQLLATRQGNPSVEWWNRMVKQEHGQKGSGSATYMQGWLIALISNRPIHTKMDMTDVKSVRFSVPVTHNNNGAITEMRILGGFTGSIYDATTDSWTPQRSLAVLDAK
jgi:hypothetical protein